MNLCLDIGNTQAKVAIFCPKSNDLIAFFRTEALDISFLEKKIIQHNIRRAMLISTKKENILLENYLKNSLSFFLKLTHHTAIPIQNNYETPHTLGKDRLAAAVAANAYFPDQNVLIIDAGTCITYDFVHQTNSYKGGGISAGLQMRFKALEHFTDKLPLISFDPSATVGNLIGDNTRNSILSGVLWGTIAELDGIIDRYRQKYPQLKVLLTGGDVDFFDTTLKNEIFAKPYLVLKGLNNILNFNVKLNVKKAT